MLQTETTGTTLNTSAAFDDEVPEGKNVLHVLDKTGDTKTIWDSKNKDEVAAAKKNTPTNVAPKARPFNIWSG